MRVRRETSVASAAVGRITEPVRAEEIVATGQAEIVLLARQELRDPDWPLHAATALGTEIAWPVQYQRARSAIPRPGRAGDPVPGR